MTLDVLERRLDRARAAARPRRLGTVTQLLGLHLVVRGIDAAVGDVVEVLAAGPGDAPVFAEVAASGPPSSFASTRSWRGPTVFLRTPRMWTRNSSRVLPWNTVRPTATIPGLT